MDKLNTFEESSAASGNSKEGTRNMKRRKKSKIHDSVETYTAKTQCGKAHPCKYKHVFFELALQEFPYL